ncbi:MAG: hypothetical protein U9O94_05970 [Nanoarchaeota archaeon]|nr:hypothetical protein [Nanoarchaeota archaeon]
MKKSKLAWFYANLIFGAAIALILASIPEWVLFWIWVIGWFVPDLILVGHLIRQRCLIIRKRD